MAGKRTAIAKTRERALKIDTPRVFLPLLEPARYKGAYGGRGSGKSHFFAELLIEDCLCERGLLAVCIREVQKSLKDSSKRLIEAKLAELRLGEGDGFKIYDKEIRTPGDGVILFTGLQDHTAEAIKSLEGFQRAWIEEAQVLSHRSLTLLRPTIRAKDSQIWASWNPRRKSDAVDEFFRAKRPADAVAVEANWRDNPWFPDVLEAERRSDMVMFPERYEQEQIVVLPSSFGRPIAVLPPAEVGIIHVIWRVPPDIYRDFYSGRKTRVRHDAIAFEQIEANVTIYYLAGRKFRSILVED
jgi:phage terminase large subunit